MESERGEEEGDETSWREKEMMGTPERGVEEPERGSREGGIGLFPFFAPPSPHLGHGSPSSRSIRLRQI